MVCGCESWNSSWLCLALIVVNLQILGLPEIQTGFIPNSQDLWDFTVLRPCFFWGGGGAYYIISIYKHDWYKLLYIDTNDFCPAVSSQSGFWRVWQVVRVQGWAWRPSMLVAAVSPSSCRFPKPVQGIMHLRVGTDASLSYVLHTTHTHTQMVLVQLFLNQSRLENVIWFHFSHFWIGPALITFKTHKHTQYYTV